MPAGSNLRFKQLLPVPCILASGSESLAEALTWSSLTKPFFLPPEIVLTSCARLQDRKPEGSEWRKGFICHDSDSSAFAQAL